MPRPLKIEHAVFADDPVICLIAGCSRYTKDFTSHRFFRDGIVDTYAKGEVGLAREGRNIVGFVYCKHLKIKSRPFSVVHYMGVDPTCLQGGIGRKLLEWALATSPHGRVQLSCEHSNKAGMKFYEKCGFYPLYTGSYGKEPRSRPYTRFESVDQQFPLLIEFVDFCIERHNIYLRRKAGEEKPWTADPILRSYRFTNVYRELDTETVWLHSNWMTKAGKDAWFAALVARHINRWQTLQQLPLPAPWDRAAYMEAMEDIEASGEQMFSGAYMINQSQPGGKGLPKYEYLAKFVFDKAWNNRELLAPRKGELLDHFHARLCSLRGLGSFMAAQVVADVKHTPLMRRAPDWEAWASSGPGSKRGLNIVCGLAPEHPQKEESWRADLSRLRAAFNDQWPTAWQPLDAQNLQNCLCEFSKYTRGYSRSRYQGD